MRRFFEYMGLTAIIITCFYYTNRLALLVRSRNPIMVSIKEVATSEVVSYVNARITDNTIIPGISGLQVNKEKSFLRMKDFGAFNENYLVFDKTKPSVSLEDNKDKIIVRGNESKRAVSFIIDGNESVKNFFMINSLPATLLSYVSSFQIETLEQINAETERRLFSDMESLLNKNRKNINICLVNDSNKDICLRNRKYLVKETNELSRGNLVNIRRNISSGAIILIRSSASLEDVNILINQISYQGLKIIPLSELISES